MHRTALLLMAALTCCNVVLGDEPAKKVPGLGDPGKLISLKIETGRAKDGVISLAGRDAAQQLIIIGVYDSGQTRDLTGKVALVTGASRGIGAAIARRLAAQGAVVVAAARGTNAESNVAEIVSKGGKAEAVSLDVTDAPAIVPVVVSEKAPVVTPLTDSPNVTV